MDISTPSEIILNNNSDVDSNNRLDSFYDKETTNKIPNQIKSSTLKEVSIKNKDIKELTVSDKKKERSIKSRSKSREKKERSRSASKDHLNEKIKEKRAKTPKARKKKKKDDDQTKEKIKSLYNEIINKQKDIQINDDYYKSLKIKKTENKSNLKEIKEKKENKNINIVASYDATMLIFTF